MVKVKFAGLTEDSYGNYHINVLVNGKKADIFLQGIDSLKLFVGLDPDDNKTVEQIKNGIQAYLNELVNYVDLTQLDNFEFIKDKR